jgi:hypothetical protein
MSCRISHERHAFFNDVWFLAESWLRSDFRGELGGMRDIWRSSAGRI